MRAIGIVLAGMVLAACAAPGTGSSQQSPVEAVSPSAGSSPSAIPSSAVSPTPNPGAVRLVVADYAHGEVRLARLDATDTATVKGIYIGIVSDQVIITSGTTLLAVNSAGKVSTLGQLSGAPDWNGANVAIKPDLSQWVYTVTDDTWTSYIHLGTATSDAVVATVPSPDANAFYSPFTWNASGVYMVRSPTGLGGAGPFLDYRFNLAVLDMAGQRVTEVSPACAAYAVLDDGTMVCRTNPSSGRLELRSPARTVRSIQMALGNGAGTQSAFWKVYVSPDHKRVIASRNGANDPVISYQMAVADLSGSSATAFGPFDYMPDTWLPDGRIVADHICVPSEWGGGPCTTSLDGTYFFSADGKTRTLFYKLKSGVVVGYV